MKLPPRPNRSRTTKKIFIVDDHPITRRGLVELINHERDLQVCGEADDARQALAVIAATKPDLVLLDLGLPDKSGLEVLKDARALQPDLAVLEVSMHDEGLYAERVLRAGGRGYVMKKEGGARLITAVRRVMAGEIYLSERIATPLLEAMSGQSRREKRSPVAQLTDREFAVFQCIGEGMTAVAIGEHLHVSSKTVDTHRLRIKEKLRLRTTPELVRFAVRWVAALRIT